LKTLFPLALVGLLVATGAQAQLLGANATLFQEIDALDADAIFQDMEDLPVGPATTPEGAPSHGWVFGPFIFAASVLGGTGQALVVLDGEPWVQAAGGPMDGLVAGAGYRASFMLPVSQIQFEVVGDTSVEIEIEAFFQHNALAPPQRFTVTEDDNVLRFGTDGVFWDEIVIRSVNDSPGWGLDNIGVGGKMAARSVVCQDTAKLSTLRF
jgi:hypothetical protein